jgi:hypothetical protein
MKTATSALVCPSIVLALLAACGGGTPEPAAPPAAAAEADSGSPAPAAVSADASTGSAALGTPADAGGAPPANKPVAVESEDQCTPVGTDFEKRVRPKMKECYATGKKKDPNLEGTVKIKITVDVKGKIKSTKVIEKSLPDAVADCILKAVKATPFPEVDKCWDSTLTIPFTVPTPKM